MSHQLLVDVWMDSNNNFYIWCNLLIFEISSNHMHTNSIVMSHLKPTIVIQSSQQNKEKYGPDLGQHKQKQISLLL